MPAVHTNGRPSPVPIFVRRRSHHNGTAEYGRHATEQHIPTNKINAIMLALMGLNHEKQIHRYAGRGFRLTDVAGNVATQIFA